jgi:hypothetical protein
VTKKSGLIKKKSKKPGHSPPHRAIIDHQHLPNFNKEILVKKHQRDGFTQHQSFRGGGFGRV